MGMLNDCANKVLNPKPCDVAHCQDGDAVPQGGATLENKQAIAENFIVSGCVCIPEKMFMLQDGNAGEKPQQLEVPEDAGAKPHDSTAETAEKSQEQIA